MNPLLRRTASLLLFALAALTLGLAGCGGSEARAGEVDSTPHPLRGTYRNGTFTAEMVGEVIRQFEVTISTEGDFDGTATSVLPNKGVATMDGEVSHTGRFQGRVTFADGTSADYAGDLVRNANGFSAVLTSPEAGKPQITLTIGYTPA